MKTIASLTILISSTLLYGTDAAVAQSRWSRSFQNHRRVVVYEPTRIVSRPIISRHAVTEPVITYGGYSHVDELATRMETLAREICWEMHLNYTHNRGFAATYTEAYDILRQAKFIHQEEHHGHRSEIARVVGELDQLFHHVEDDIRSWRPSHNHFVSHGSLFDKMEEMEDTLHHLMQDVGVKSSLTEPPPPTLNGNPPLPVPVSLPAFPTGTRP